MTKEEIIQEYNKINDELRSMIEKLLRKNYSNNIIISNLNIDIVNETDDEDKNFIINFYVVTKEKHERTIMKIFFDKIICYGANLHLSCIYDIYHALDYDTSNQNAKKLRDYLFNVE